MLVQQLISAWGSLHLFYYNKSKYDQEKEM